ncbi:kinase-like domain-containing protein [Gautieria morchelliformis]|nr:kinase-like domain-containing protein [Gautieria morchelliformis]
MSESTLQQDEHRWIVDLLEGKGEPGSGESTVVPGAITGAALSQSLPRVLTQVPSVSSTSTTASVTTTTSTLSTSTLVTPTASSSTDDGEYEDESESESEAGTLWQPWKPGEKKRSSKRVSRVGGLHPIQTSSPPIPALSPVPPPPPSYRGANGRQQLSPGGNVNRHSSFTKRDSVTWAFRPPPEDMYERLEEFFPDHDLDKPVIETPSGGSSPTQAEHPPPPAFPSPNRARHKKSIRVVAHERASKIGSTARDVLRKRSTKLWGSRVEEVTPAQAKGSILSATPDSPPGVPNPKPIFKWVKGDLIGKGTYGRVYLALNATTGEMIAVKQVELPKTASDQNDGRQLQVVEALLSESDTLKELDHPNIVQYLGFEQSADHWSIFLEYVPGGSIGGCLRKHGKFDHEVVRSFTSQMLAGLEYLHMRGVLHRDLKADNILLDPSGVCKISDFGISKRSDDIYDNNTGLTAMQGSIFWMAPEMMHNNKQGYNAKIDIWSLGCVVLEMWAGRRPWNQEHIFAVMFKLGAEKAAPPVPDDVELDPVEDDFRLQCFAVNPNERPTAAELRKHNYLELKPGWTFTGFK